MRVTLIQCTKTKRDEKAPAKDLYDESAYFRDMRAYAKAQDNPWYILSANHNLVDPETVLEPYDAFGLSEIQAHKIAHELSAMGVTVAEVVAGSKYTDTLIPELEKVGIDVIDNFPGQKIGERRHNLQVRTSEIVNGSLC